MTGLLNENYRTSDCLGVAMLSSSDTITSKIWATVVSVAVSVVPLSWVGRRVYF